VSELRPLTDLLFIPQIYDSGEPRRNDIDRGKAKDLEKNLSSTSSSSTNPTWPDRGANPALRGQKPATNRLSHGTA
jgi:hypothetical protein